MWHEAECQVQLEQQAQELEQLKAALERCVVRVLATVVCGHRFAVAGVAWCTLSGAAGAAGTGPGTAQGCSGKVCGDALV
jgi:hypothetical protein